MRLDDIVSLGLSPIPETFDSSLGRIVPLLGWNELCVWVHESLVGAFPAAARRPDGSAADPGETVAAALRALAAGAEEHV